MVKYTNNNMQHAMEYFRKTMAVKLIDWLIDWLINWLINCSFIIFMMRIYL
jgi:hypothetical protein